MSTAAFPAAICHPDRPQVSSSRMCVDCATSWYEKRAQFAPPGLKRKAEVPPPRKLTTAEKSRIPEYRDKWDAIARCTEPADRRRAELGITHFYSWMKLPAPEIVWYESPVEILKIKTPQVNLLEDRHKLVGHAQHNVRLQLAEKEWSKVCAQVGVHAFPSALRETILFALTRQPHWSRRDYGVGVSMGQQDGYLGAYDFVREVCGMESQTNAVRGLIEQGKSAGWYLALRNKCYVAERPQILKFNDRDQLHSDNGPALAYPDGWSMFFLNGVQVPRKLVTDPREKLDVRFWMKFENVEVRREFIRLYGMQSLVEKLDANVLDTVLEPDLNTEYELLAVEMGFGEPWRFLKMLNPSVGTWHIEAVPRECQTVQHAINYRRYGDINKEWSPITLT